MFCFLLKDYVAIKIIPLPNPETEDTDEIEIDETLLQLRSEIDVLRSCNHPNVVSYLGTFVGPPPKLLHENSVDSK